MLLSHCQQALRVPPLSCIQVAQQQWTGCPISSLRYGLPAEPMMTQCHKTPTGIRSAAPVGTTMATVDRTLRHPCPRPEEPTPESAKAETAAAEALRYRYSAGSRQRQQRRTAAVGLRSAPDAHRHVPGPDSAPSSPSYSGHAALGKGRGRPGNAEPVLTLSAPG